ncbi:hypothetical protein TNCV_124421 [Trichonephila clavipes]|nr:hypothetical protein TNCV_124421 [Trichonephila clavipes]
MIPILKPGQYSKNPLSYRLTTHSRAAFTKLWCVRSMPVSSISIRKNLIHSCVSYWLPQVKSVLDRIVLQGAPQGDILSTGYQEGNQRVGKAVRSVKTQMLPPATISDKKFAILLKIETARKE